MEIILASSSRYRKMLLERWPIRFETAAPEVDETPLPGESPADLVRRLALAKARAVSASNPHAVVIGSDQVAVHGDAIIGKPGSPERAREQLSEFSGREIGFLTAFAVVRESAGFAAERMVVTEVEFRELSAEEIQRYVELDNPIDCAGGFKSEANGTTLLKSMRSDDPSAIMGLPLIALSECLRQTGLALP